jgi:CubicO group peptidase (beta-lactamase class C family)
VTLPPSALAVGALLIVTACAGCSAAGSQTEAAASVATAAPVTAAPTTTSTTSTTSTSTTTISTTTISTTTISTTTISTTTTPTLPAFEHANRAFDDLAAANPAVTMTVVRDGRSVLQRASGNTIDGANTTSDSPMVVASVSKLLTALMIARLDHAGTIEIDAPMPWADLALPVHPDWQSVTARELLAHTSGMPVVRSAWFDGEIDCASFLPFLLGQPPTTTRGRWTYSNGNHCALGLFVERTTGLRLDQAAQSLLFDPLGGSGAHLTTDALLPTDVEYRLGVARLSRLGGAGTFVVSTDDVAAVLATVTSSDLDVLIWPGVFVDQYGWGHTGTVDAAAACAWVLEGGRTVVAATVSGGTPSTGGLLCDRVVRAVADDLGIGQGRPDRSPP